MDMNVVASLIGSLGFPIVCCIALFWFLNKTNAQHKEEMNKMSEAINNNTAVMNKLIEEIKERKAL
jgi:preprotein translocase subunit YajC